MPEFYRTEALDLLNKYYPIEISVNMTEAEKVRKKLIKGK